MKLNITVLYIIVVFLIDLSAQSSGWTRKKDLPIMLYRAPAFSIDNKGYVATGLAPDSLTRDIWEYNPQNDSWTRLAPLPALKRYGGVGFAIGGKGYVCGGITELHEASMELWEYDPKTDSWERKADMPEIYYMPQTLAGFSVNNKGYVMASYNNDNFYEYDPATDSWSAKANFPGRATDLAAGFSIGDKGYIGTGFGPKTSDTENRHQKANFTGNTTYLTTVFFPENLDYIKNDFSVMASLSELWEYSPESDSWTRKADFPGLPRMGAVGFSIFNTGYIGLGSSGEYLSGDFWAYYPESDSWTPIDSSEFRTFGAFAFSIGAKAYTGTGIFAYSGDFWEYNSGLNSIPGSDDRPSEMFLLEQNYPNPFNPVTTINFHVPQDAFVTLKIYDMLGAETAVLVNEQKTPGHYKVNFNGSSSLAGGVYFYKLTAGDFVQVKKMVLLK
jgi:N-acetylneuraminic acid mutarotase